MRVFIRAWKGVLSSDTIGSPAVNQIENGEDEIGSALLNFKTPTNSNLIFLQIMEFFY